MRASIIIDSSIVYNISRYLMSKMIHLGAAALCKNIHKGRIISLIISALIAARYTDLSGEMMLESNANLVPAK